ncbi:hypothetical protein EV356DRAFT_536155 [Viridothelium virens]|uniref:G-protein coupled receptors family 2 profile 2 domain-containing protein n=1 Tax=Viridothelium virens TaxID=1048519 RepID=A0A6A6GY83_VIRVR|nr:hypothetical protein EV356DRAFT_536155 [Viridothelium virens]
MFSHGQLLAIEAIERIMSVVSLCGALFIICSFLLFRRIRKPINRLVFYATFGNLLTNVATLVSTSGIHAGNSSALCIFQGFFIQMLMPADAFWTFCMALNVYLTFFRGYTANDLRRLEKWYFLGCYGVPFIPALVYLVVQSAGGPKNIYGNAMIWCWVSLDYDWMRIAFFYAPVWFIITIILTIYVATGREIFIRRAALREFEHQTTDDLYVKDTKPLPSAPSIGSSKSEHGFGAVTKVTEIQVTSEPIKLEVFNPLTTTRNEASPPGPVEPDYDNDRLSFSSQQRLSGPSTPPTSKPQFWWSKTSGSEKPDPFTNPIHDHGMNTNVVTMVTADAPTIKRSPSLKVIQTSASPTALSTPEPRSPVSPLAPNHPDGRVSTFSNASLARPHTAGSEHVRRRLTASQSANKAALSYYKVALLMFVALSVVWIPSTINRLYSLVVPEKQSFPLNFLAAGVLPMQGAWNAAVFLDTSWTELKKGVRELREGKTQGRKGSVFSDLDTDNGGWRRWKG